VLNKFQVSAYLVVTVRCVITACKDSYDDVDNTKACELGCANQQSEHPLHHMMDDVSATSVTVYGLLSASKLLPGSVI